MIPNKKFFMVTIDYLGHASFKVSNGHFSVVLDPYENGSVPGLTFPSNMKANIVLCSHEHRDHNARDNITIEPSPLKLECKEYLLPHDHEKGSKRGLVYGRIFKIDNISFAHLGDIGDVSPLHLFEPFKGVDVLFIPINGFYTTSSQEAKILIDFIKPKLVVPMHYQIKEPASGYPDNGQIDIFKHLFPRFLQPNSASVVLNPELFSHQVLIFNISKGVIL